MAYFQSPDFSSSDLSNETDDSSHLNLRTRTILRPMDALSGRLPRLHVVAHWPACGAVVLTNVRILSLLWTVK